MSATKETVGNFEKILSVDEQYHEKFVDRWDELIDWDARAKGEGTFFIDRLNKIGARRILDVAGGTGFHSIQLVKAGFDVVTVDISRNMILRAKRNAVMHNVELNIHQCDWLTLHEHFPDDEEFDAVLCLGSSFVHLIDIQDRRAALNNFRRLLKPAGALMLDHRNFDAFRKGIFTNPQKLYYSGKNVTVKPRVIGDICTMNYHFSGGMHYILKVAAMNCSDMVKEIQMAGFPELTTYGDFDTNYKMDETGFFIHIAKQ